MASEGLAMSTERPMRADARRNRDLLLAAAIAAFSTPDADVALESIARDAGVGIGTLYRHFPTRESLVEAAYRSELERLCDAVPALLSDNQPDVALRAWMDLFIDYMATKRGMAEALRAVIASGGNPFAHSRELLLAAVSALLVAGVEKNTLRSDVGAPDVLASLSGISLAVGDPAQREQASRLLDLLVDGLRFGAGQLPAR